MATKDSDSVDLDRLYRDERSGLIRLAFMLVGSLEVAEDVFHDAVSSVTPKLSSIDQPGAYLRRAVINAANASHRKTRSIPDLPEPIPTFLDSEAIELWHSIQALDYRRRAAIVLRYYVDLPVGEIAEHMDCSVDAVSSLLYRALADLRKDLDDE